MFEKTSCLITADGANDDKIQAEALSDYKVEPPLPIVAANAAPTSNEIEAANPDDNEEEKKKKSSSHNLINNWLWRTVKVIAQPIIHLLSEIFRGSMKMVGSWAKFSILTPIYLSILYLSKMEHRPT